MASVMASDAPIMESASAIDPLVLARDAPSTVGFGGRRRTSDTGIASRAVPPVGSPVGWDPATSDAAEACPGCGYQALWGVAKHTIDHVSLFFFKEGYRVEPWHIGKLP